MNNRPGSRRRPERFPILDEKNGYTILKRKSTPKWKMTKASTVMKTALFSLFSKIF
jgi:hypothetical protein